MKPYTLTLLTITAVAAPLAAWMSFTPPMLQANASPLELAQAGPGRQGKPQMGHMGRGGNPGEHLLRMADELGLSDGQRNQIQALFAEAKTANEPLWQEMQAAREQMHSLMDSGASQAELQAHHGRMQALRQQMSDRHFSTMMAVREVLTPEQQAKLQEMRGQMHGERGQMRGDRGRMGQMGQGPANRPANARPMQR
ncbi:MAG: periplasmic heavy metal sensor [Spirulina sp. DLM2.Bin59]|nr:MAG: periplasmic heavy metal sensor [Spirulina sp. DLM2.Bin59]